MEKGYASSGSGGSLSVWGARSRLPEKSMRDEGALYAVNNRRMLNDPIVDGRFGGDDEETSLHSYKSINHSSARGEFRETSPQTKDWDRLWNVRSSRAGNSPWEERTGRFEAFSRNQQEPQYQAPPFYGYGTPTKSHHDASGPISFDNLEADRAELMWKLEQLNFQIRRLKETGKRLPSNRSIVPTYRHNARFTHYVGPVSSTSPHKMEVSRIPALHRNFPDTFGSHVIGTTRKYTHHPSNGSFLERTQYIDPEPFELYPRDQFPPHPPGSRKFLEDQFHHHGSPVRVREVDRNPVLFESGDQLQLHERLSINSSSNNSSNLGQPRGKITLAANKKRKHCVAIAGGAPFIICSNCFSALILPRRMRNKEKNLEKVQCGSCSTVIFLCLEEKRLIACITEDTQEEVDNRDSSAILNDGGNVQSSSLGLSDFGGMKSCIDSERDVSRSKPKENAFSREEGADEGRDEKMVGFHSSLSSPEEGVEAEELENSHKGATIERSDHTSPALPSSTLERNPLSSASEIAYESQKENEKGSDNMYKEKADLQKSDLPHCCFNEDPDVTELEVSASEYPITSLSQDYTDTSKEEDRPKNKKGGRRSFKGLMKRSIREQMMHEPIFENMGPEVTINGHPIPDDLVKQAEVLAGPILPGDYW